MAAEAQGRRQRAPAAPRPLLSDAPRAAAMRSREILAPPATSMADTLQLPKRGPFRSTWARSRKARPQLTLSRRPRRRLRLLRWCGRRRLRRRLLEAQEAGADWREGSWLASRSAAAPGPKTAVPSRAPRPLPSPTPSRASSPTSDEDEDTAPSCSARLPIPPLRPAGPGRALLLLPREQVSRAPREPGGLGGGRRSPEGGRRGETVPLCGSRESPPGGGAGQRVRGTLSALGDVGLWVVKGT